MFNTHKQILPCENQCNIPKYTIRKQNPNPAAYYKNNIP